MRFFRWALITIATFWAFIIVLFWLSTNQLFNGYSRDFDPQARYAKIMAAPEQYGIKIDNIACANTRCLVIRALPDTQPDTRYGSPIREQLHNRGIKIATFGEQLAWLVMLHGKGSRKEELVTASMRYVASGFSVIIPDLPMHGENVNPLRWGIDSRDGDIATNVLYDAQVATGELSEKPAFLWAISMGGTFANRTVEQHPNAFKGLIIATSYDSLENVMKNQVAILGKIAQTALFWQAKKISQWRGLAIEKSTPAEWAKHITLPVLFLHGDQDKLIPHRLGKALFDSYQSRDKRFITVTGARHQNLFITSQPVFAETISWMLERL